MSTNILYGNSAVTQNEIFNTFFVGIRARWARSPWARQVDAGLSSLFKFCRPSIHVAVAQSTIPTNWDKFTINIKTVFTFCPPKKNLLWHAVLLVRNSHLQKLHFSLHALAPGDWLMALSKPKVNRFFPHYRGCSSNSCSHNKNLCITSGLHLVNW